MFSDDHFADRPDAVAVIGMSGRFPGASNVDALWDLLVQGRDAVTEAPPDRPWLRQLHDPRPITAGRVPSTHGGFLPGLDLFDADFFDMPPREARRTDPQLRLLLEVAYEACQDAGTPVKELGRARTGVYVGAIYADYWLRQLSDLEGLDFYAEAGASARSAFSGRVAYAFDLRGPAITVDSACSSSLAAVHLACQSLRAGECDLALVGGSNIILTPYSTITLGQSGALSPNGRSRFADAAADGYVRGEAVGAVLLKPLREAMANGDRVRAVILGSAVNNDGCTGRGMIAPSLDGQIALLRTAYDAAAVDPREVAVIEAHGTGTKVGDQVELTALSQVLGPRGAGQDRCLVGSAKACIGHTEGAAGVVGLIKAVLCLENRIVPGNPQITSLSPAVDWSRAPVTVPSRPVRLDRDGVLVAGVNSFGATGTNAHVVLGTPPPVPAAVPDAVERPAVLTVSARSAAALRDLCAGYGDLLSEQPAGSVAAVCKAAATRRDHWEHRLAVVGDNHTGMSTAVRAFLDGRDHTGLFVSPGAVRRRPMVVFVFPGQGSQWHGMGRDLLDHSDVFRRTMDTCDAAIRAHAGWSLLAALHDDSPQWLERTELVQPALWAFAVSLASMWRFWGVTPDAVVGQSQGEIAAAHCAGALSLDQAARLSCLRADLVGRLAPPGGMCWVERPHTGIAVLLEELGATASIAVVEGPASTVLSGATDQIDRVVAGCERLGVSCQRVEVSYAAHSPEIDPLRQPLLDGLTDFTPDSTSVPFLSTVTGEEVPGADLGPDYWWRNLREPVRLDGAVHGLRDKGPVVFLQMAPHPVLTAALHECAATNGIEALTPASSRRGRPAGQTVHEALAALYTAGLDPNWERIHGGRGPLSDLPGYPWQHRSYWHQAAGFPWPPLGKAETNQVPPAEQTTPPPTRERTVHIDPLSTHPLLDASAPDQPATEWRAQLSTERAAFLLDHRVGDRPVLAGAVWAELTHAIGRRLSGGAPVRTKDLLFLRPLPLTEPDDANPAHDIEVLITAEQQDEGWRLRMRSRRGSESDWDTHATAVVTAAHDTAAALPESFVEQARDRCREWRAGERFYREHAASGNTWNGAFRGVAELWIGSGEAMARIRPTAASGFAIHPATLDSCLQPLATVLALHGTSEEQGFVLAGVKHLRIHRPTAEGALWTHVRRSGDGDGDAMLTDVTVLDEFGNLVVEANGIRAVRLTAPTTSTPEPVIRARHAVRWRRILPGQARPAPAGSWLLVSGGTDWDAALARRLTTQGRTVYTAHRGGRGLGRVGNAFHADLDADADLARIVAEIDRECPLHTVVSLLAVTAQQDGDASARQVQWTTTDLCASAARLTRVLGDVTQASAPRLVLLTRGAQVVTPDEPCTAPWQAALWGMGQVLGRERPGSRTILVDLDAGSAPADDADDLVRLLTGDNDEDCVALRDRDHWAPRIVEQSLADTSGAVGLHTDNGFNGLVLASVPRRAPGEDQVEITVTHAGLNYHDVLAVANALHGSPEESRLLGGECAGVVSRMGPNVTGLSVGDEVLAVAHPALRSHVVVDQHLVMRKPPRLSLAEASAQPAAYISAYHALVNVARLRAGERLLVHSATGGVGMAALELAHRTGAVAYATAGSAPKRDLLRKLGVAQVADSRTTAFAEQFRHDEEPFGVDVILNTLTDDAVDANFSLLNPMGRYIDLAANDIARGRRLPMSVFARGRAYHAIDFEELYTHHTELVGDLMRSVMALIDQGDIAPLPHRVFPVDDAVDAFLTLARAEHTGKLTLAFPRPAATVAPARPAIHPDATYLVTGGLGGIGRLLAEWLVDRGARHLLLTGRTPEAERHDSTELLDRLLSRGAQVDYAAVDVADEDAMSALLNRRRQAGLPQVAGVAHTAAVLEPAIATGQSLDDLDRVLRPKVAGAWVLHRLFAGQRLDFFVLFSSVAAPLAGLTASSGLGAYAAGNAFLDALTAHRRASGLPATTVNWGYWDEVGLAARLSAREGHDIRPAGMLPINPADAPELFTAMLAADGRMIHFPVDWASYLTAYPRDADAPILRDVQDDLSSPVAPVPRPRASVTTPLPENERRTAPPGDVAVPEPEPAASADLEDWLATCVARVLGLDPGQVDRRQPVSRLGVDSLMANELRSTLRSDRGLDIPLSRLLNATSLRELAVELATVEPAATADAS